MKKSQKKQNEELRETLKQTKIGDFSNFSKSIYSQKDFASKSTDTHTDQNLTTTENLPKRATHSSLQNHTQTNIIQFLFKVTGTPAESLPEGDRPSGRPQQGMPQHHEPL